MVYPFLKLVIEFKNVQSLIKSVKIISKKLDLQGRIHPEFNQFTCPTGRIYSYIQNLPKERWGSTYVWDVMTPAERLITISPDDPATEALSKMSKHDLGRILVLENGKLIGIVTRSDVMRAIRRRVDLKVEQV